MVIEMVQEKVNSCMNDYEYSELLDNMISLVLKLLSSSSNATIELLDRGLETASCISTVGVIDAPEDVKFKDIIKLLSDPNVKRGIYVLLSFIKSIGECYRPPDKV